MRKAQAIASSKPLSQDTKTKAVNELWRRGKLRFLLRPEQKIVYDHVHSKQSRRTVLAMHRGAGKSYLAAVLAIETALATPGVSVLYAGPTAKMVRGIVLPHFRRIIQSCPDELRPVFRSMDGLFEFKNGSVITVFGVDGGNADAGRGKDVHLFIFDEAGFADEVNYVINSIIMPRALPVDGRILLISTPPKTGSHDFAQVMRQAESEGILFTLPVTENPRVTPELLAEYKKESGGEHTTTYRREYLCQICTEEKYRIVRKSPVQVLDTQQCELSFTTLAVDVSGLTIAVWWYESEGYLVARKEMTSLENTLQEIFEAIKEDGKLCLGSFSDDLALLLGRDYGIPCHTMKLDINAGVAGLDDYISKGLIRVDSAQCPTVMRHLHDGIWNDSGASFAPSGDTGSFDAITLCALSASFWSPRMESTLTHSDLFGTNRSRVMRNIRKLH